MDLWAFSIRITRISIHGAGRRTLFQLLSTTDAFTVNDNAGNSFPQDFNGGAT